ncbi:YfhD family protein [Paenibacillus sp. HB172176]|uniref:YfhD family protein n=1 Tax=Paenibacillus sp. HB172176 TaxID=2493690 RepID=UPI00143B3BEC|nr:YfhD family protein [Paenibacillus sp. HB172176]
MTDQENKDLDKVNFAELPIGKEEDVEFSEELADEADHKAQQRAAEADKRVEKQQD